MRARILILERVIKHTIAYPLQSLWFKNCILGCFGSKLVDYVQSSTHCIYISDQILLGWKIWRDIQESWGWGIHVHKKFIELSSYILSKQILPSYELSIQIMNIK